MRGVPVVLEQVVKRYADGSIVALDNVDLEVAAGETIGIMGPSGSGKSTMLHVIGAMDAADSGRVVVGGRDITHLDTAAQAEFRRTIGFVFQRFHLLPALSALDNVAAPLLPYKTDFDKHERAQKLLEAVGLGGRAASVPARLSGGEAQRVAIARALVNNPAVLLADEPTGNLDSQTGAEIMQLLLDLQRERDMTVVIATHDPLIASRCERIIRLLDGRVLESITVGEGAAPDEVLERIGRIDH